MIPECDCYQRNKNVVLKVISILLAVRATQLLTSNSKRMKTNCLFFAALFLHFQFLARGQNRTQISQLPELTPYGLTTPADVKKVLDRVLNYVDPVTPAAMVNRITGEQIIDLKKPLKEATLKKGEYSITSHEWGLAYTGMLQAGAATGDHRFTDYVSDRKSVV